MNLGGLCQPRTVSVSVGTTLPDKGKLPHPDPTPLTWPYLFFTPQQTSPSNVYSIFPAMFIISSPTPLGTQPTRPGLCWVSGVSLRARAPPGTQQLMSDHLSLSPMFFRRIVFRDYGRCRHPGLCILQNQQDVWRKRKTCYKELDHVTTGANESQDGQSAGWRPRRGTMQLRSEGRRGRTSQLSSQAGGLPSYSDGQPLFYPGRQLIG